MPSSLITTGLVVVSIIFPLLSLASIILRFQARLKTKAGLQGDDWWIVATWILSLALSVNVWVYASLMGVSYYSVDDLTGNVYAAVCLVVASCMVQVVLTTVKVSILLLYKRIFVIRSFRIAVWIAIVFVLLWGLSMILIVALQGNPATYILTAASGKVFVWRLNPTIVGYTQVGSSLILDVIILCFPLPVISRLHMPQRRKVMVGAIFWLGVFCCVASAVRLALNHKVLTQVLSTSDTVALQATQFCFLIVEPHCSIIAACLPTFGPLIAGGRAPESLIRSVRSILSLASRAGSPRNSKDRTAVRLPSNTNSEQHITSIDHEQCQLVPATNTTNVQIISDTKRSEDIELADLEQGINVTKGIEIVRS